MTIYSGTITNPGTLNACQKAVRVIKEACEAEGWVTLEYNATGANHHWVGKSTGISGTENIIIGVRSFFTAGTSYSIAFFGFANYLVGTPFLSQATLIGNHYTTGANTWITFDIFDCPYRLFVNKQRVIWTSVKTGDIVSFGYAGFFWRYAAPSQYPLPLIALTQPNDVSIFNELNGDFNHVFTPGLTRTNPSFGPQYATSTTIVYRESDGETNIVPIQLVSSDVLGELDGVCKITGDGLLNRTVIQVGGASVVDQTGMTDLEAAAAINSVGGTAWIGLHSGTNRNIYSAYAVRMD